MAVRFDEALRKAEREEPLGLAEVVALLQAEGDQARELFRVADGIRRRHVGDEIHLRGLIEFSNHCGRHCLYCGLRAPNRRLVRYRMPQEEIVEAACAAARLGIRTVVLQSGEDAHYTADRLADLIEAIKARADVAVTLCIGERSREEYRALRAAGADRYLLRHETADPALYAALHPDMRYERRLQCLRDLRAEGFQVGAGSMVGLPGQTIEMMARDILLLRELEVDMAGIGPFIPHPDTPLGGSPPGNVETTLKMLALARIVVPDAHLPATTALATLDPRGREKAFAVGANVVMPNITPLKYREHYTIYPNKRCLAEEIEQCLPCLRLRIEEMGRRIGMGYGHSLKRAVRAALPVAAGAVCSGSGDMDPAWEER